MLGKLIKYEFKATSRIFPYMYAALIIISLINMIIQPWSQIGGYNYTTDPIANPIESIMLLVYVFACLAVIIISIVVIIVRFYKNLLGDEGYLMFTLPVKTESLVASKLIVGTVWSVLSVIVVFVSLLILLARTNFLEQFYSMMTSPKEIIALIVISTIISMTYGVLQFYTACAIGPHIIKNRLGGSILAFIIIYVVSNIVSVVLMFGMSLLPFVNSVWRWPVNMSFMPDENGMMNTIWTLFIIGIVISVVIGLIYWFVINYILKRKLNLA